MILGFLGLVTTACSSGVAPKVGALCDKAYSSSVEPGSPEAPVLIILNKEYEGKKWEIYKHPFIETVSVNAKTIVCIRESREEDGNYIYYEGKDRQRSGTAYRRIWDIRLVQFENGSFIGKGSFVGGNPPPNTSGVGDFYGETPDTGLLWMLRSTNNQILVPGGAVYYLAFSPDGKTLLSGIDQPPDFLPKGLVIWDLTTREAASFRQETGNVMSLSPDGRILASAYSGEYLKLWDMVTGKKVDIFARLDYSVYDLAFSPDSKILAVASSDKSIRFWDINTGQEMGMLVGHKNWVNIVAFSPDGKTLASASGDRTVKLWDWATSQEIRTISKPASSLAFSPDGKTLALASEGEIILWNFAMNQELRTYTRHGTRVFNLAFSPDSHTLASASIDNTVKLWNAATGKEIRTLIGHGPAIAGTFNNGAVLSVAFSPDGKILASGGRDGVIKLWDVTMGR